MCTYLSLEKKMLQQTGRYRTHNDKSPQTLTPARSQKKTLGNGFTFLNRAR